MKFYQLAAFIIEDLIAVAIKPRIGVFLSSFRQKKTRALGPRKNNIEEVFPYLEYIRIYPDCVGQ